MPSYLRLGVAAALLALALSPQELFAQGPPSVDLTRAKGFFDAGENYYNIGEYQKALEAYQEVYRLTQAPELLFNIAQCHRLLLQRREALDNYQEFLKTRPESPYRAEIEGRILELKDALDKEPPASAPVVTPPASTPVKDPPPKPPETPDAPSALLFAPAAGFGALWLAFGAGSLSLFIKPNANGIPFNRARLVSAGADLSLAAAGVSLWLAIRAHKEPKLTLAPTQGGALLSLRLSPTRRARTSQPSRGAP